VKYGSVCSGIESASVAWEPMGWTAAWFSEVEAWRVLDAQYFGVAQRRRRVFVVASARDGFDPAAVLFESESLRRDTPPSREAGPVVAALTANGVGTCGADDNQGQAGHLVAMAHGQGGAEIRKDGQSPTLTCNHEAPIVCHGSQGQAVAFAENSRSDSNASGRNTGMIHSGATVRRLTPIECERLQGFKPNHTRIAWRKKPPEDCPDGPRYKAIGNSKAVPVIRWVGERIKKHLGVIE